MRRHLTARVSEVSLDLIDAWAAHIAAQRDRRPSRADAIEQLILQVPPPERAGPTEAAVRRAYGLATGATRIIRVGGS